MFTQLRPAAVLLALMTLITGVAYPLLVTGIAQGTMGAKAGGSLIEKDGKAVGSRLIGQGFSDPKYFWGRPSATSPFAFNAGASSGSNQGPVNAALADAVRDRVKALREADPDNKAPVPIDLVTASASGLDPHISVAAAEYQVGRVAAARKLDAQVVRAVLARHTEGRTLGLLGEPRVNVLEANLELDGTK
jgi:K+-transporting ATPase ATPase C chain